jgi:hypothetical protein
MRNKLHQENNPDVKQLLDMKENKKQNLGLDENKMTPKPALALAWYPTLLAE